MNKISDEETKVLQIKDVKKTLEFIKNARNNTNLSEKDWKDKLVHRKMYLDEYVEYLKTGKRNCITVKSYDKDDIENLQHFK